MVAINLVKQHILSGFLIDCANFIEDCYKQMGLLPSGSVWVSELILIRYVWQQPGNHQICLHGIIAWVCFGKSLTNQINIQQTNLICIIYANENALYDFS